MADEMLADDMPEDVMREFMDSLEEEAVEWEDAALEEFSKDGQENGE